MGCGRGRLVWISNVLAESNRECKRGTRCSAARNRHRPAIAVRLPRYCGCMIEHEADVITGHISREIHERYSTEESVAKLSFPSDEAGDRPIRGARTRYGS